MNSYEKVLHHLFGDQTLETVTIDHLQNFVHENPYFSLAQLFLAKKLKAENSPSFLPQVQKTALYFSNPYWLHYQLTGDFGFELNSGIKSKTEEVNLDESFTHFSSEPSIHTENVGQAEEEMAAITRDTNEETDTFLKAVPVEDTIPVRDTIEVVVTETLSPDEEAEILEVSEEMAGVINEPEPSAEVFLREATVSENESEKRNAPTEQTAATDVQKLRPATFDNYPGENEKTDISEPDEHERMFRNIKAMLDAGTEEADANVDNAVIPIDPYYTIDYFASQGIKLELDQNPKDELGQHLKKFTQWLKHMKKLGPEDATEVINRSNETEADIQRIADSSNTVREVVTEAMALVLEKQGKKDKAIELYTKLSFLNPDKSIYFANKIKTLKGI